MCGVCGCGDTAVPLVQPARTIQLEAAVLGENDRIAGHNRSHFAEHGVLALNFVSSPGSGKTTLLCSLIERLRSSGRELGVIEGDQHTSRDAERIRALGVPAVQVNTGRGCHLDAAMVGQAFGQLHVHGRPLSIVLIENVGNLVCPALWDLGERAKVVVVSVTEGDDKPLKYPDMFAAAQLLVVNKIDLLPCVSFDVAACVAYARRVQPALEHIEVSATRGDGLDTLSAWLLREAAAIA